MPPGGGPLLGLQPGGMGQGEGDVSPWDAAPWLGSLRVHTGEREPATQQLGELGREGDSGVQDGSGGASRHREEHCVSLTWGKGRAERS